MAPGLMLATPTDLPRDIAAHTLTAGGLWVAERKLDGIRVCATIDGKKVKLTNRRGANITYRYRDVVGKLSNLGIRAVVDGEIVVYANEKPSFALAQRRDAQGDARKAAQLARSLPAAFVAFDVLFLNDLDLRALPYDRRRERLTSLPLEAVHASEDGQAMWDDVVLNGLEGLVLKRRNSRYESGRRSRAWVKVKRVKRLTALVGGYDPGEGHRAPTFGALHLVLVGENNQLIRIGSVGTGFSNADCLLIRGRLDRGDHPIVVEVEYLEVSKDGKLRQPSFKGCRLDVSPLDCRVEQLDH